MPCPSRRISVFCYKFIGLILFVTIVTLAPAPVNQSASACCVYSVNTKTSKELLRLITRLRAQKARVALTSERVKQPFFSPLGRLVNIEGQAVQVFEYAHLERAEKEATLVSADGMTIGGSKPFWMAPPHFFKGGRLIVIYVGNEPAILKLLHAALGKQFAGA
ncbi:MAG TPA: hypothetical protein VFH15_14500 [Pyrinomonadaceae bacterium]|nr:hypothetical protein [Pyrinomonadaceae bacterium]